MKLIYKLMLGFLVVSLMIGAVGGVSLFQLFNIADTWHSETPEIIKTINKTSHLDGLAQFIRYYDEVLTQSARNYAFTQNKKWKERYQDIEPELDKIINEAINEGDKKDRDFFSSVYNANTALVRMEYKSIEFVDNGHNEKAIKILESGEYWRQKNIYEKGLKNYVNKRGVQYNEVLDTSIDKINLLQSRTLAVLNDGERSVIIVAIISVMLVIAIGILVFHSIVKPLNKLKVAATKIGKGEMDTIIDIKTNDEIGMLATSFNKMAVDLKKTTASRDELNKEIYERKQAEKLANNEKNKLKAVVDAMQYGLTIQDREYNIIYQNEVMKNIFGRYGEKCYKVYEGKDKICEGCPVELAYKDGKSHSSLRTVTMPSGEIGYWENTANPIRNSEGEIVSCLEIARNITEQKKMEKDLIEKEERFRAVATSTSDLIWEGDIRDNSLHWFGDIDGYLGYENGEFPHTISAHTDSIHPDDQDRFIKEVGEAVEKGQYFQSVYRIKCKRGTLRYWEERGIATGFQDGKAVRWTGSITDITDRMKDEDKLIESEAKFKRLSQEFTALLDAIPDSLILLSPDLKILWSNRAFDFKIGGDNFKGQHCYKLCCNIASPCNNCPVIKSFKSGKEEVTRVVDMDGKILDKRAFPTFDMSGNVSNVIEVARDITAEVRMEEEARLIQTRLIQANKMTSLGTLVSGVAHEVNNPNSYILTNAQIFDEIWKDSVEILKEHYRDNKELNLGGIPFSELLDVAPKLISGIHEGSIRIKKIVENLKDFSRAESYDLGSKVNMNTVIMSARSLLDSHIGKYTNKFHINCDDSIPPVKGSTQQLEQVIINLIMNALQSLPDNESGILISTSYNKKSKTVNVKVKDEGCGISDEILGRVTEPFFTTKLNIGGTGLGLSISYTIIKDHKGSLLFKSKEGKGTVVTVNLPVYS